MCFSTQKLKPKLCPFLISSSAADESGSGQPEGMDIMVCRAPGGEFYVEGETWNLDECTRCTCRKGRVLCDTEVCPPALCQTPIRNKDTCCHVCPGRWKLQGQGGGVKGGGWVVGSRKKPWRVPADPVERYKAVHMSYQHVASEGLASSASGRFYVGRADS